MAVAFDAQSTAISRSDSATSASHTNLTVGTGSNRAIVAVLCMSGTNVTPTMTWNGVAMELIASTTVTNMLIKIFALVNPASGNLTLAASWTTARNYTLGAVAFTGVDQTGGATSFPNATTNSGTTNTSTVTITSAVDDYVVAGHVNASTGFVTLNNTQIYLDNAGSVISDAANRAVGAASVTMTCTLASNPWNAAGLNIKAATAAGGLGALLSNKRSYLIEAGLFG